MNFDVQELTKARADKREIFKWLSERSQRGARAWLDACDDMLGKLKTHAKSFGEAHENADCQLEVKQAFFKTRRGRVYRILFFIDHDDVYVLRIRGPGQAPVNPIDFSRSAERRSRRHRAPRRPTREAESDSGEATLTRRKHTLTNHLR